MKIGYSRTGMESQLEAIKEKITQKLRKLVL